MDFPEFYRKYRPTKPSDMVGQIEAIAQLRELGKSQKFPHVILFHGPSGTGKTTLARIVAAKLNCEGDDYQEINAADDRGIDMVRQIGETINYKSLAGGNRVWVVDEAQNLSPDAQSAFLKYTEDIPEHAYIFFATTDPQKLKPTLKSRCMQFALKSLTTQELTTLVQRVGAAEGVTMTDSTLAMLVEAANGSAREALVMLHSISGIKDDAVQRAAINKVEAEGTGFQLAQILCRSGSSWKDAKAVMEALGDPKNELEAIRQTILSYARKCLLGGNVHVIRVIEEFKYTFFESGTAGFTLAVYRCYHD